MVQRFNYHYIVVIKTISYPLVVSYGCDCIFSVTRNACGEKCAAVNVA